MAKYYVWSKKNKLIVQKDNAVLAAACLYVTYKGINFGKYIYVSQVGFNRRSGHPEHKQDCQFTFTFIQNLCEV